MYYTGLIYRPPFEAKSLLLQVTSGCSHNKCSFCTMYTKVPFRVSPLSEVEEDLQEASACRPQTRRVFLEGGDAFCLSGDKLIRIAELVKRYLPNVSTIAMYASINNIRNKTDEELKALHELGVDELNIGLESGDDYALLYLNKGFTAREARLQLDRLRAAGIRYGLNVIFGASGRDGRFKNARETAALVNYADPYLIFTGTIHADPGCKLYEDMKEGKFIECTIREYLEEEKEFLELLELTHCKYFGLHPANVVPMMGMLPEHKERLMDRLIKAEQEIPAEAMDSVPLRFGEGGIAY